MYQACVLRWYRSDWVQRQIHNRSNAHFWYGLHLIDDLPTFTHEKLNEEKVRTERIRIKWKAKCHDFCEVTSSVAYHTNNFLHNFRLVKIRLNKIARHEFSIQLITLNPIPVSGSTIINNVIAIKSIANLPKNIPWSSSYSDAEQYLRLQEVKPMFSESCLEWG